MRVISEGVEKVCCSAMEKLSTFLYMDERSVAAKPAPMKEAISPTHI